MSLLGEDGSGDASQEALKEARDEVSGAKLTQHGIFTYG
jgi:hypothetical protein